MKISRITSVLFLLAVVAAGAAGCSLGIRRPAAAMWQKEGARRTEQRRGA